MEQLGHLLFSLDVLVEIKQLPPQIVHHVYFLDQHLVELHHVVLHIRPRLINLFKDGHFLFDDLYRLLARGVMLEDQLLLLFQDLLNELLVV